MFYDDDDNNDDLTDCQLWGWGEGGKNESDFVIVVTAVSPKPEFSQQFCPRS